mmetsp:Transcript_7773/g.12055  ORF Transcript_7773/g.12055 Transcript_7773/m.12055 type:complete len:93 (-) Transcript_7773:27-305(-)
MQLRSCCIEQKQEQMFGVITNSRDWIFTRYNIRTELENKNLADMDHSDLDWARPFEYSPTFRIFDLKDNQLEVNTAQLQQVVCLCSRLFEYY